MLCYCKMSCAIDTTVDFRRKLLRFDRPLYPGYVKSDIPRFYSSFIPGWRSYFDCEGDGKCEDSEPQWYPESVPVTDTEYDCNGCYTYTKTILTPHIFTWKLVVLVVLAVFLFYSNYRIVTLASMIAVYYYFPNSNSNGTMEMFDLRPVRQRGMYFNNPSWER